MQCGEVCEALSLWSWLLDVLVWRFGVGAFSFKYSLTFWLLTIFVLNLAEVLLEGLMGLTASLWEVCPTIWLRFRSKSCSSPLGKVPFWWYAHGYWGLCFLHVWESLNGGTFWSVCSLKSLVEAPISEHEHSNLFVCFVFPRPLRGFDLVKDRDTGNSKGYGFCVYQVCLSRHFRSTVFLSIQLYTFYIY